MPPNSSSSRLNDWPINKPRIWWQDLTAGRERDAMRMTRGGGRWSGSSDEKDDAYRVMARWCCYCCCFNCCCWCTVLEGGLEGVEAPPAPGWYSPYSLIAVWPPPGRVTTVFRLPCHKIPGIAPVHVILSAGDE